MFLTSSAIYSGTGQGESFIIGNIVCILAVISWFFYLRAYMKNKAEEDGTLQIINALKKHIPIASLLVAGSVFLPFFTTNSNQIWAGYPMYYLYIDLEFASQIEKGFTGSIIQFVGIDLLVLAIDIFLVCAALALLKKMLIKMKGLKTRRAKANLHN